MKPNKVAVCGGQDLVTVKGDESNRVRNFALAHRLLKTHQQAMAAHERAMASHDGAMDSHSVAMRAHETAMRTHEQITMGLHQLLEKAGVLAPVTESEEERVV